jgi:hypothetical protein
MDDKDGDVARDDFSMPAVNLFPQLQPASTCSEQCPESNTKIGREKLAG